MKFLTSLQVTAATGAPPAVGNQFTIGLAATDSRGQPATYFNGDRGNIAYSVTGGQITVVPEPASWALLALGIVPVAVRLRRRRSRGDRSAGG